MPETDAPVDAAPASPPATQPAPPAASTKTYVTADFSDEYGPMGRLLDLSDADAKAGLKSGVLATPTPDQLARR